jgi:Transposase and inactivated derivatives
LGLTDHGVRAVLDVVLTGEEDVVSYWDLLVRLWRRYNLTLVVADGVKALDTAISRSGIKVARQTCLVHLKRSRRVRDALDLLLSLAESVPTRGSRGSPDSRLTRETFAESVPTRGSRGSPDSRLTRETFAESVPTRGSPLLPPRPQGGPSSGHLAESFNSLLESSASATPPGGPPGP